LTPAEQLRLQLIFEQYRVFPALRHCYWVKEQVRALYRSPDYAAAEKKLNTLINMLADERIGKLKEIREMLKRWKPYILNYFHNRTTNAFIEGVHNKIKLTKRLSFGFRNFRNYVLKVTLALLPFAFLPGIYHTKV
jgi:transposase